MVSAFSTCCVRAVILLFFFNDTATTEIYTLSLHDALPICQGLFTEASDGRIRLDVRPYRGATTYSFSSEGHTKRALTSLRGLTGNSLEQALNGLSDSLSANRAHLVASAP